jgi:hypothetical protein
MLSQHNFPTEHDGSLSHGDAYFGEDHTFSPSVFAAIFNRFRRHDKISFALASGLRTEHVFAKSKLNPEMLIKEEFLQNSMPETELFLSVFGDPASRSMMKSMP